MNKKWATRFDSFYGWKDELRNTTLILLSVGAFILAARGFASFLGLFINDIVARYLQSLSHIH